LAGVGTGAGIKIGTGTNACGKKSETRTSGGADTGTGTGSVIAGTGIGTGSIGSIGSVFFIIITTLTIKGMEVDGVGGEALVPVPTTTATATTGVTSCSGGLRMATALALDPDAQQTTATTQRPDLNGRDKGNMLISQCSNAKVANRTATILDCTATENGPAFVTVSASVPRFGKIVHPELDDYSKTFHGARFMKNSVNVNEVITSSFDPKTLTCLACAVPHKILNNNVPFTLCLADQNFVPTVCCRGGGAGGYRFRYR
jgi:hypothetical protein